MLTYNNNDSKVLSYYDNCLMRAVNFYHRRDFISGRNFEMILFLKSNKYY